MKTATLLLGWTAVLMGVVHIMFAFPIDEFRSGHLWFIGSGLALVFAGFINLLGQEIQRGKLVRLLIPLANFILAGLFIAATFVLDEPQVYIGITLFGALGLLTIFSNTSANK